MAKKRQTSAQRNAIWALVLAGVACVATGLIGLVRGTIALQLYPVEPAPWNRALGISAALILAGLAIYSILVPERVRQLLTGRQARYGSNALVLTLAFVGILIVVNVLAYQNPKTVDFTEGQQHTLAPETLQALSTLPDDVLAIAFYSRRLSSDSAEALLQDFKINSNGKFDYQFIDPDVNPVAARQYGVTGDGKIMLIMGESHEIASFASETELTRTLIRLISPDQRTVYFLTGHGEPDINGGTERSISEARVTLEGKNYIVQSLNLIAANTIPEDAQTIVIAGPIKPLSYLEITQLREFLDGGGGLVVLQDPLLFTQFGDEADPLEAYLETAWSIKMNDNVIVDQSGASNPLYASAATVASNHPITQNMTLTAILPQARSLTVLGATESISAIELMSTSEQSWGEVDYETQESWTFDATADQPGPLVLAAAAENVSTGGRVVVFGNSLFITDEAFGVYGNADIFVNAVDWSAQQDDLIQITPREPIERQFLIPSQFGSIAILLGSIFVLPGLVLLAGVSAWLSRRRRG